MQIIEREDFDPNSFGDASTQSQAEAFDVSGWLAMMADEAMAMSDRAPDDAYKNIGGDNGLELYI